ncbi:baseplate assembly protein [Chengkuizengella axinellae]|uniref:Baseplate J/gp47 family protein n=1 Tax=Chengkuizengella axinellae TaxID=3064388 RepID=A0ABT9J677_9BACL|nr:baseplate J/gp47 family protein [Chengkuizengella sp. 2205SS18-9]MDP5277135.1 baseplate J/gp47 family protein [Chengkuizengella sp. 2205SS18-9]
MSVTELPNIEFLETNVDSIKDNIITMYESLAEKKLYPGDPVQLFLLSIANIIVQQSNVINETAKQNLLRYATGDKLDHIGARVETQRLPATAAQTTVQFNLSASRPDVTVIPKGLRVSPDGTLFFELTENVEIIAGDLSASVQCECLEVGTVGNGYLPGQINLIVDPLPYVATANNTTESAGGTEKEGDDAYRERIYQAPESFSTAGPVGAYDFWAKTASKDIIDVTVHSPSPGVVEIIPLIQGGATTEVINSIHEVLNDKKIRPLTDFVQVVSPENVSFDVDLTYWIDRENEIDVQNIQNRVNDAVSQYIEWQQSKLGRSINPSELTKLVLNAGAERANVVSPIYTSIENTQIAVCNTVLINYGGID